MSDDDAATDKNKSEAEETAAADKAAEQDASVKDESAKEPADAKKSDAKKSGAKESSIEESSTEESGTEESSTKESAAEESDAKESGAKESAGKKDDAAAEDAKADTESTVKLPTGSAEDAKSEDETVELAASEDTTAAPAAAASAPADSPAPQGGSGSKRNSLIPLVGAFVAGVVAVAAIAALVVFWKQAHDRGNEIDARKSAVSAACDFGHQVGTYDAKDFDDYIKRVKDRSTGDWLTQFNGASSALKQITQQAQARSTVGEIHCAYESGDANKASVVMLITQEQSKAATPTPQPMTIGVVASMQKKDGKWMVDNFQSPMTNDMQSAASAGPGADAQQPAPNPAPQPGN